MFIFITVAHHFQDDRVVSTPFFADIDDPAQAVEMARQAELYGFALNAIGTGVTVVRLRKGIGFKRCKFEPGGDSVLGHPIVYRRIIRDGTWAEEWLDEEIKKECEVAV